MSRHAAYFVSKLAVITGGTSGIGFALAERLAGLGASVVVLADKGESLSAACSALLERGLSVQGYICDVGERDSVENACRRVLTEHVAQDILIDNCGYAIY